jgi:hypothetical protein
MARAIPSFLPFFCPSDKLTIVANINIPATTSRAPVPHK